MTAVTSVIGATESRAPRAAPGLRISATDVQLIDAAIRALDALHGKWKVHLLVLLARGVHRHGELLAHIPGSSKKVMTAALRRLEQDGLVVRRVQLFGRPEYALTPLGWSAAEPLVALADWGAVAAATNRTGSSTYRNTPPMRRPERRRPSRTPR